MGERRTEQFSRADARKRARRDLDRRRRREPAGRFWHSVALMGSVGWPIVLLATGGALLGRWADQRWDSGVRFTLMFLAMGTVLGTWIAFRTLGGDR